MSTAFANRTFVYVECSAGAYQTDGSYLEGPTTQRTVNGTIQPMSCKETLAYTDGSRNTGLVKVYSNERLSSRTRGEGSGGFVSIGGIVYRLADEMIYQNSVMSHWKYIGCMVPENEIPASVFQILGGAQ